MSNGIWGQRKKKLSFLAFVRFRDGVEVVGVCVGGEIVWYKGGV